MTSHTPKNLRDSAQNKNDRRAAAREAAKQVVEDDAARRRRNTLMGTIAAILAVAIVAGLIWFIVASGNKNGGASAVPSATGADAVPSLKTVNRQPIPDGGTKPVNTDQFGGITLGKSQVAGSSNADVPNVTIYFDYLCIYCNQLESEYSERLDQQAKDGKITLTYVPIQIFRDVDFSTKSAQADYWFAANHPDLYLKFHDTMLKDVTEPLFKNGQHPDKAPELSTITDTAAKVGLSKDEVAKLQKSLDDGEYAQYVQDQVTRFHADGFQGTPTVLINDQELENWPGGVIYTAVENASK